MSSLFSAISIILSLLYSVLRISKDFMIRMDIFKRNKKIRDKYKQGEKAVKNGNVKEINDIIRDR
jgi:hypothetical protein